LGVGLKNLVMLDFETTYLGGKALPYKWDVLGQSITLLLVEAVGFIVLTLLIDDEWFTYFWKLGRNYLAQKKLEISNLPAAAASNGRSLWPTLLAKIVIKGPFCT
jgi:hypothetical protein